MCVAIYDSLFASLCTVHIYIYLRGGLVHACIYRLSLVAAIFQPYYVYTVEEDGWKYVCDCISLFDSTWLGCSCRFSSVSVCECVCVLCLSLCTISGNVVWVNMSECMCPCIRVWFRAVCVCVCVNETLIFRLVVQGGRSPGNVAAPFTRRWSLVVYFASLVVRSRCVNLAFRIDKYIIVVYIAFASVSRRAIRRFRVVLCLSRYW